MGEDGGTGDKGTPQGEQKVKKTGARRVKGQRLPLAHPAEVKVKARDLYMSYTPRAEICRATGISEHTIDNWVRRGDWYRIRETENKGVAVEVLRRKAFLTANIAALSFEALSKAIATVSSQTKVSLEEGYKVSMILAQLDKVVRLSQGEPTDIVKHEGTVGLKAIAFRTEKEIRAAIAQDPMIDIPEQAGSIGPTPGEGAVLRAVEESQLEVAKDVMGKGNE